MVWPAHGPPKVDDRQLQTGTGTAQTTAISIVASAAVIFSLVDKSMASSERDANLSAALYAASRAYCCDADHTTTGCLVSIAERACRP